jgi:ABC-type amino acid transport substrate-binding protein
MNRIGSFILLAGFALLFMSDSATALDLDNPGARELTIGTKIAPPFAMKDQEGKWSGISIELWQRIADHLKLRYRLVEEPTVQGLLDRTANNTFDAAVAAITVTSQRETAADFSLPYYVTGLGIAVPLGGLPILRRIGETFTSFGFLQALLALLVITLLVAFLIWLFERRHNEDFGGGIWRGLTSSIWWSAEAMSQASTGFRGPKTPLGRAIAIVWMAVSIIMVAVFTAALTSTLTTERMQGVVRGVRDLGSVRVGAVAGTATTDYLTANRIRHRAFTTPQDGLKELEAGRLDAFVYDKPLLAWIVQQQFSSSVEVTDIDFDPQYYAVAFPIGSKLRYPFNISMLKEVKGEWWKQTLSRYQQK